MSSFKPKPQKVSINGNDYQMIAFYYPDYNTSFDHVYQAPFLGNFYKCDMTLDHKGIKGSFHNTEAAFQATKWWNKPNILAEFEKATTGGEAYTVKKKYHGTEDWSYAGYNSNLKAMRAILDIKFQQADFKMGLLDTAEAYLLEHNEKYGRDSFWSDNQDGSGQNHLGLMLMDIRAALGGSGNPAVGVDISDFTNNIKYR